MTAKPDGMSWPTYHEFQAVGKRIDSLDNRAEGFEVSIETSRVARVDILAKLKELQDAVNLAIRILKVMSAGAGAVALAVVTAYVLRWLHLTS